MKPIRLGDPMEMVHAVMILKDSSEVEKRNHQVAKNFLLHMSWHELESDAILTPA
jgi:hypothetical protein